MLDELSVLFPDKLGLCRGLQALVLEAFALFGESDTAILVVRKADPMELLVAPPQIVRLVGRLSNRSRREKMLVQGGRLENA